MKYKKFHNLIEEEYAEQKQAAYERLKEELNLPDDPVPAKRTHARDFFKTPYRLISCLAAAMVAVCLAIVLPVTLLNTKDQPPEIRYLNGDECENKPIDYTLKEYGQMNGIPYLYLDWYDFSDVATVLAVNRDDPDEVVYVMESLTDGERGYSVTLYVTDKYTRVDTLNVFETCVDELVVRDIKVLWGGTIQLKMVCFEYGDFRYMMLIIDYGFVTESFITDMVESMLP